MAAKSQPDFFLKDTRRKIIIEAAQRAALFQIGELIYTIFEVRGRAKAVEVRVLGYSIGVDSGDCATRPAATDYRAVLSYVVKPCREQYGLYGDRHRVTVREHDVFITRKKAIQSVRYINEGPPVYATVKKQATRKKNGKYRVFRNFKRKLRRESQHARDEGEPS